MSNVKMSNVKCQMSKVYNCNINIANDMII